MNEATANSFDEWARLARSQWATTEVLAAGRMWQQAFYHSGFVIECALKARIMRSQGLNRWPDRQDRPDLYTHRLAGLAAAAGLIPSLTDEAGAGSALGLAWLVVKDWSPDVRYDARPFSVRRASDMVESTGQSGLLEWILGQ